MYYFYWLPIGTDAKVRGIPWVTLSLVVAHVVVFAAIHSVSGAEAFAYRLAFKPGDPTIATAIASLFLHAGPLNLIENLLFLGVFGPPLEARMGAPSFLVSFVACGWLANLAEATWIVKMMPEWAFVPILGASGAISGLMGLFLVRLPFARLRFASFRQLLVQGTLKSGGFMPSALIGVGVWFALQFLHHLGDFVPEAAAVRHVSGLLAGILLGWGLGLTREGRIESYLALGGRHAERAEWFAALSKYEDYLARVPDDPEVTAQLARIQRVTHQEAFATESFCRAIHHWLQRGETGAACDAYEEMKRLLGAVVLPAADLLRVARACEELGRPSAASRAYEAFGRYYPDRDGAAVAMLKSAEIEQETLNNPGRAKYLYDELLLRQLTPEIERVVREHAERAGALIARQHSAV
jgi:membrane associated rhomboid family serine protease